MKSTLQLYSPISILQYPPFWIGTVSASQNVADSRAAHRVGIGKCLPQPIRATRQDTSMDLCTGQPGSKDKYVKQLLADLSGSVVFADDYCIRVVSR